MGLNFAQLGKLNHCTNKICTMCKYSMPQPGEPTAQQAHTAVYQATSELPHIQHQ